MVTDDFSDEEKKLLELVPSSGIGNKTLRQQLGWDKDKYFEVRNKLMERGVLLKGRGRGGSTSRVIADQPASGIDLKAQAEQIVKQEIRERDLYPKVKKVLETDWALNEGLHHQVVAQITASQGARGTGGKWSRPDITLVAVEVYDMLPSKYVDVVTFEVKAEDSWDITGVFEAAAHSRAATKSFLAIHTPKGPPSPDEMKRLSEECKRFEIGLMTFDNPSNFDTYEVHVTPERKQPDPDDLNEFLTSQLSAEVREKIRLWLR